MLNLVGGSTVQPLPWDLRLKILIGAARGLAFLHASDKQVIYRDFKASNILLDGVSSAQQRLFSNSTLDYQMEKFITPFSIKG